LRALVWAALAAIAPMSSADAAPKRKVVIDSEPSGASVYLGDKEAGSAGVTPVTVELPTGDNVVILELDGYVPKFETIEVPKGKGKPLRVSYALDRASGTLLVTLDGVAKGARVLVDDEDRGPPPLRLQLAAGSHRVEVVAKGRTLFVDTVDVSAGAEARVRARAKAGKRGDDRAIAPRDGSGERTGDGESGTGRGKRGKRVAERARPERADRDDDPEDPDRAEADERDADPRLALEEEEDDDDGDAAASAQDASLTAEAERRPRPSGAPAPRRLRVAPLVEVGYRYLDYSAVNSPGNTPALSQRGAVLLGARVDSAPLRRLPNFTVGAAGGYGVPQTLSTSQGNADSIWWRVEATASYRLPLGARWAIQALVGYGFSRYQFFGSRAVRALVPDASYSVARLGVGGSARIGWVELNAMLENRPVLSGGTFADRFRNASADGLAARLGASALLGPRYFARFEGSFARYAWSFDYDVADTYRAGGANDVLLGLALSAGAAF
jgi:PEGA domain